MTDLPTPSAWRSIQQDDKGKQVLVIYTEIPMFYTPMFTARQMSQYGQACFEEGREARAMVEPMTEVADRFAHRMALELECVLSDGAYSNKWYKSAMQVLSEYRSAMNDIHEKHSPTFMGEPHSLEERHTAEKRDRQNAAKWERTSASFDEWWDSDVMPPANPFAEGSAAYWAWAGWQAAQRPWQGLTDEDVNKESTMIASKMKLAFHAGMYVAQQVLKERNT
jgi:hypothetical protein